MKLSGIDASQLTYAYLLNALAHGGAWEPALQALESDMPRDGVEPNLRLFTSALSACEFGGQWLAAMRVFENVYKADMKPDVVTWTALINACARGGQLQLVKECLEQMVVEGVTPNVITYNSVIRGCVEMGELKKAVKVREALVADGLMPDTACYDATLKGYARFGLWEQALAEFQEMKAEPYKLVPQVGTYISMAGGGGESEAVVVDVRLVVPFQPAAEIDGDGSHVPESVDSGEEPLAELGAVSEVDVEDFLDKMLSASGPEGGAQSVSMEDVVRQIDCDGMDIDRAHAFMSSTRFRQCFRVMGVRIYRVVVGTSMQAKPIDERKRWIGSFPRSLTKSQREAHWNSIQGHLTSSLLERVQPQFHGVAKSYVLVLPTPFDARSLSDSFRSLDMVCVDPRGRSRRQVRVRQDLPLDVRSKQRAASSLRPGALELVRKTNHPLDGFKLGVNGCQGLMHLASEDEVWELFHIKGSDAAGWTSEPISSSWRARSVQDSDARALVALATGEELIYEVARRAKFAAELIGPGAPEGEVSRCLALLGARGHDKPKVIHRAPRAYLVLREFFCAGEFQRLDFSGFSDEVGEIMRGQRGLEEQEVKNDRQASQSVQERRVAKRRGLSAARAPAHRRLHLTAVVDCDGGAVEGPDAGGATSADYRVEVARVREVGEAEFARIDPFIQSCSPSTHRKLSFQRFHEILRRRSDGAPGADGVLYSACKAGGLFVADAPHSVYSYLLDGGAPDREFNRALAAFLPKSRMALGILAVAPQAKLAQLRLPCSLGPCLPACLGRWVQTRHLGARLEPRARGGRHAAMTGGARAAEGGAASPAGSRERGGCGSPAAYAPGAQAVQVLAAPMAQPALSLPMDPRVDYLCGGYCVKLIGQDGDVFMRHDQAFCSTACRRRGMSTLFANLRGVQLERAARGPPAPSEVSFSAFSSTRSASSTTVSSALARRGDEGGPIAWVVGKMLDVISARLHGSRLSRAASTLVQILEYTPVPLPKNILGLMSSASAVSFRSDGLFGDSPLRLGEKDL
ncbi:unnamed protein product [Prorocentrum cordatum]|uniref:FLZ-type domain-containing protein n=1 Tax=Prorocentrum cordatum TaxID=2364126 RepID=A0ABN9UM88_9DINO|nr:unnamed protein product [Polarella glacialis]